MKKVYMSIPLIIIFVIVIFITLSNNNVKNDDKIIEQSNLVINTNNLIKESKVIKNVIFQNCSIVTINGKTKLKVELKNDTGEIFTSKKITFNLLNSNNNIIVQEIKSNIIIVKDGNTMININFDKEYNDVYDIQYIVE